MRETRNARATNNQEVVAIAAAYEMAPGRFPELSTEDLFRKVLKGALSSWDIKPSDIDGLLTHPSGTIAGYDIYFHDRLVTELGLKAKFVETLNLGGATYPAMVNRAANVIRAGRCKAVLCIGAGKFTKLSAGGGEMMARAISDPHLEVPYGTWIPALYGLLASEFMADHDVKNEDIARMAVSERKWALLNPDARMRKDGPISVDDVLRSRMISTPFHYLDCSVPSDGGGAVLVTTAAFAKKLTRQPAYLLGWGEAHLRGRVSEPGRLTDTGAIHSGAEAFKSAGLTPKQIDVAQLYDAFSVTPLVLLENLGFCKAGSAAKFVNSGGTDPGGQLPVNTYGGLLSFGHTGDASGMSLVTAGALQVMGTAGPNQVDNAKRVLIHGYGGIMYDHATLILGRKP
jgi:acetyl-CoA acetyltransferase